MGVNTGMALYWKIANLLCIIIPHHSSESTQSAISQTVRHSFVFYCFCSLQSTVAKGPEDAMPDVEQMLTSVTMCVWQREWVWFK